MPQMDPFDLLGHSKDQHRVKPLMVSRQYLPVRSPSELNLICPFANQNPIGSSDDISGSVQDSSVMFACIPKIWIMARAALRFSVSSHHPTTSHLCSMKVDMQWVLFNITACKNDLKIEFGKTKIIALGPFKSLIFNPLLPRVVWMSWCLRSGCSRCPVVGLRRDTAWRPPCRRNSDRWGARVPGF